MKLHYFDQDEADKSDMLLGMAKMQGYVPETCLLGGATVMHEVQANRNPCDRCAGPREKCKGSDRIRWMIKREVTLKSRKILSLE